MSNDSFDALYTFGRPVESYVSVREHARLLLWREALANRTITYRFPVAGTGDGKGIESVEIEYDLEPGHGPAVLAVEHRGVQP